MSTDEIMERAATLLGRRHIAGFTLLELLAVMLILGLLVAIGIPMLANVRHASELASAEQEVIAALNRARWMAITSGRPDTTVQLANCSGAACLTIEILDTAGGAVLARSQLSAYGATVSGTNIPFSLDNRGFLKTPGTQPSLSVTSTKLGSSRIVSVTQMGKIQSS